MRPWEKPFVVERAGVSEEATGAEDEEEGVGEVESSESLEAAEERRRRWRRVESGPGRRMASSNHV